jgi:subtilisin family serine protease
VAGSIAAKNNGSGVVGVAPGTKVWAVKVLDSTGSGSLSSIVCGIDWVTANAVSKNIKVLNMSLGGSGEPVQACETTTDPMHQAVCRAAAGDVLSVVAAGNDGWDFDYAASPDVPAAYPQALTVTALSDSDGRSGGTGGPPACRTGEADDAPASFSNFAATSGGAAHTIAAPGTCITSTWPTDVAPSGGYTTISGTSMAAPHIAGAAALCENDGGVAGACAGKTPAEVISSLRATAQSHTTRHPAYGFAYDPAHTPQAARYFGYLAVVDTAAPDTEISGGPSGVTASSSASFSFSSTEEGSSFECRLDFGGWESCSSPTSVAGLSEGSHVYSVRASDAAGNTDASEATRSFTVDTAAPDTSITAGPSGTISSSSASFSFSATEAGSSFECKLDAGSWIACSSPKELTGLSEGSHTFSVRAKDAAGNTDASEATRSFTIDLAAPPPPDSDGDGVPNASDQCPTVAGSPARGGCSAPAPTAAPPIPPATVPSNAFTFIGKALVRRRLTILTLSVPGPGVVKASQAGTTGTRTSATKPLIKPVRVTADAAGKLKLKIRPSKAGKRRLRKKRSFSVRLKITYTPNGGTPRSSIKRVKVKR